MIAISDRAVILWGAEALGFSRAGAPIKVSNPNAIFYWHNPLTAQAFIDMHPKMNSLRLGTVSFNIKETK